MKTYGIIFNQNKPERNKVYPYRMEYNDEYSAFLANYNKYGVLIMKYMYSKI